MCLSLKIFNPRLVMVAPYAHAQYGPTTKQRSCFMAASCSERRDVKLESFLNRTLPPEEYERLLARQPAVAVVASSDRGGGRGAAAGKPAHRHAVLGHCKLYLTDVPPKNLRTTLLLKHVESILIVSELR